MRVKVIESSKNAEYKRLLSLHDPAKARKEGVFLLEGDRAVRELDPAFTVESLWASKDYKGYLPEAGLLYRLPEPLFQKAAETVHAQGVLAVVTRLAYTLEDLKPKDSRPGFWILLENLQDPGNAGTILRTADACAASGVICTKGTVDLYNSKAIRSCMGSLFHLPFLTVETVEEAVRFVQEQGGRVIGTSLKAAASYTEENFQGPVAVVIGNEGSGMSQKAETLCDGLVRIPMPGKAESLNASVAAGVMMYEVLRQRQ